MVQLLLEKGADVNAQTGRALREASKRGRLAVMRLLLEKGAVFKLALEDARYDEYDWDDEDDEDDDGKALQPSSADDHKEVIKLLLNKLCLDSRVKSRALKSIERGH